MVRSSRAFWWGAITSILVGILAFASGVSVALHWGADLPGAGLLGPTGAVRRSTPSNLKDDFAIYWQTWDLIEQKFYRDKPLDHKKMIYASVAGLLHSLGDDYTFFQEPEDASKMREQMQGSFDGIGAYIEFKNGQLVITAPIEDAPAAKAGLQAGDIILKVDSSELSPKLANMSAEDAAKEAAKILRGPSGSKVTLTVLRPASNTTLEIAITRGPVPIITVNAKMLDGNVAYIQITQFEGTTTAQLDKALAQLLPQQPRGIILDLRNNPGGLLDTAREVLGRFVDGGVALHERFGNGAEESFSVQRSMGAPSDTTTPMLVLINANAASASEIVAGALRDRGRATLLGEKSYGKGSVQSVECLSAQSLSCPPDSPSARITIARWLTPNNLQIHHIGISPDYYVPYDNKEEFRVALPQVRPGDADKADNSQLFWALKLLAANEKPPVVPTPTAVPTAAP